MPKTTPCLWFDTQAEEAATFYTTVFPNSRITDVSRYPGGAGDRAGTVLTVEFELDGQAYVALNAGPEFTFSEAISFQIPCAGQDEVDHYWNALTAGGGEESQCGWLKDRFGLSWQVFPEEMSRLLSDPDPERAQRAMDAMMTMKKIDLEAIEKAAAG